jgi:hypothetical protein
MNGMDELIAFLRARYDEIEAAAGGPPGWKIEHWTAARYDDKLSGRNWRIDAEPRCVVDGVIGDDARFIVLNDPAHALARIAGNRKIVDMAEQQPGWLPADARSESERHWDEAAQVMMAEVLHHLADEFAAHPDYNARMWGPLSSGNPVPEVNPGG